MINFKLNGKPQQCSATPDTSVLELLRDTLGSTGTKEGCASGDCGACTVAIGEPGPDGQLRYHSANACITPAHQLNGRHLVTVDGLADGEALHPAQAAMVECHASQCGFCTPGIVMSLFTLHEAQRQAPAPLTPQRLEAALGGNLCRCTGYRPIRDAALSMHDYPHRRPDWLDLGVDAAAPQVADDSDAAFVQPATLAELIEARGRHPQAPIVAGGTDLWLDITQRLARFTRVIDVTRVAELNAIDEACLEDGRQGWWIGAAVSYSRLEPLLETHLEPFAHLLHRLGSAQVRNRGTLGGNIANASPIGDTPPVLLALGARLRLAGPDDGHGVREREIPLDDFFLDYKQTALGEGEVIHAIFLPRLEDGQTLKVWKLSKRREDDISAVLAAFSWKHEAGVLRDVRLAFGGMAATPQRAAQAEAALEGQPPSPAAFQAARLALQQDFQPMTDVRGSAHYRQLSAANLLERLRLVLAQQETHAPGEVMLHAYAH
ncbi:xanthine dehydrogenase small subunit [Halomonas campisalis]|uniref:Xanthine dehydrogenase small subunit n=1 Tax=Billgrantia campisalis TaxID=74661 RepID=A0ABS9PD95_9GAMM|nr:xanthine dehydrogenase small subunit [Halomonas campisalis]MCG6659636.1 xanthine dehydrogenase small subunit [Halomonas campisalis]MDR5864590.1 xanthine dehydrogenase small subunit [Halomonas campisalis]